MRGAFLRLSVGRSTLRAELVRHGSVVWVGDSSYTDATDLADAIARLAAEPPHAGRRLVVTLERPPVQVRTLTDLPPVKQQHLTALIAQQAGRFFRRNGARLVTDATWVNVGQTRVVCATAIDEPLLEAIATGARAAGLWLESIAPADGGPPLFLLPPSERANRERAARGRTRRLAVTTCSVWLGAGALFAGRVIWERRAVESELEALAKPLAAVLVARRELRDAETTLDAVTTAEHQRGRALSVLVGVTGALPDSGFLTNLVWRADGSGVLVGVGRQATDVLARLDRLGTLSGPRLGGPIVREPIAGRDWERFSILFGPDERQGRRDGS